MWSEQIRVRVYERKNDDWLDRGTGICHGGTSLKELAFMVVTTEYDFRQLLEMDISKHDRYEKQQDTLIVWIDKSGNVMALSFEKTEGCLRFWDFVTGLQKRPKEGVTYHG